MLVAIGFGLLPGMALPFALAASLSSRDSDAILLALGVSQFLVNVVFAGVEANAVTRFGGGSFGGGAPSVAQIAHFVRRSLPVTLRWTAVTSAMLIGLTAWRLDEWHAFAAAAVALMGIPLVGTVSSTFAGILISRKHVPVTIVSQGFRALLPIAAVLVAFSESILVIALLYLAGEVLRALFLGVVASRLGMVQAHGSAERPRPFGLDWQYATSVITQSNPPIDRLFLAGSTGSVTAYELADKIAFAFYQVVYNFGIVGRLHAWAGAFDGGALARFQFFVRDVKRLFVAMVVLAAVASGVVAATLEWLPIPADWRLGATWALIALWSMPFAVVVAAAMRFCVILGIQRQMTAVSTVGVLVNVVTDLMLFAILGPVGIVVASIVTRLAIAASLLWLVRTQVRTGRWRAAGS